METIRNFFNRVENNDEDFENVDWKIFDCEFQYFEKIDKGELNLFDNEPVEKENGNEKEQEKLSFKSLILEYSDFKSYLLREYTKRSKEHFYDVKYGKEREIFNEWFLVILDQIDRDYNSGNKEWIDNIKKVTEEKLKVLGPIQKKNKENPFLDKNKEKFGLISFDVIQTWQGNLDHTKKGDMGQDWDNNDFIEFDIKKVRELMDFTLNDVSDCLVIHFADLSEQKSKDKNVKNIFSSNSLSILAKRIVEEYSQVEVILGKSWLIDSPIGNKIGFNKYREYEKVTGKMDFWGQFINENGQIDDKRIQEFLRTGIPKYKVAEGFIKTEDFLKKYLPEDMRGLINLKKLTTESLENLKEIEEINKKLTDLFFELPLSVEENDKKVNEIVQNSKILTDYVKTEKGKIWLKLQLKSKEFNIDEVVNIIKDFNSHSDSFKKYETKQILIN